jgi:hypothetical protein
MQHAITCSELWAFSNSTPRPLSSYKQACQREQRVLETIKKYRHQRMKRGGVRLSESFEIMRAAKAEGFITTAPEIEQVAARAGIAMPWPKGGVVRPSLIPANELALAYELRHSGVSWKNIGIGLGRHPAAIRSAVYCAIRRGINPT